MRREDPLAKPRKKFQMCNYEAKFQVEFFNVVKKKEIFSWNAAGQTFVSQKKLAEEVIGPFHLNSEYFF